MVQMLVTGLNHCCYIVAKPGSSGGKGRPIYMVCGATTNKHMNVYLRLLIDKVSRVLNPFVYSNTMDEVLNQVPKGLPSQQIDIINSRWPFFHAMRKDAFDCHGCGFPQSSLLKSIFQSLYNVIKGGLDANTQQYVSIRQNVKVSFEQNYVIKMILANVSNSWRAYQLLNMSVDLEEFTLSQMKRKVKNSKIKLQKFCHDLALALIRSAEGCNLLHVLAAKNANVTPAEATVLHTSVGRAVENNEFECDSSTLRERLAAETWPIRYKVKQFNRNPNFVELCLTHSNIFNHQLCKMISNHGKNHCALCYHRQTQYGCNLCKVLLCRTPRTRDISDGSKQHIDSCFNLWHSNRDIEIQRKALIKLGKTKEKNNAQPEVQVTVLFAAHTPQRKGSAAQKYKFSLRLGRRPTKNSLKDTVIVPATVNLILNLKLPSTIVRATLKRPSHHQHLHLRSNPSGKQKLHLPRRNPSRSQALTPTKICHQAIHVLGAGN
jgi:hypothetical protein